MLLPILTLPIFDTANFDNANCDTTDYDTANYDIANYDIANYDTANYDIANYDTANYDFANYVSELLCQINCQFWLIYAFCDTHIMYDGAPINRREIRITTTMGRPVLRAC